MGVCSFGAWAGGKKGMAPPDRLTQANRTNTEPPIPKKTHTQIIVEEAPLPEDIQWQNIDINFVTNYLRTAIGHLLTLSITLAFMFPTAFISALNSVETLKKCVRA